MEYTQPYNPIMQSKLYKVLLDPLGLFSTTISKIMFLKIYKL